MSSQVKVFIVSKKRGEHHNLTHIIPFIYPYMHASHHCRNIMAYAVTIVRDKQSKHKTCEEIYGMIRSKMSIVINEGIKSFSK